MKNRSFTLVEILIALVIMGIVATLAYPLYQNAKFQAIDKVDAMHLRLLKESLEIYLMEHDKVPAIITQIPREDFQKAYAKIMQSKGAWKIKLASWWLELTETGYAYAGGFCFHDIAKGDLKTLCSALDPACSATDPSFGINNQLADKTAAEYRALPSDFVLFGDSSGVTFDTLNTYAREHFAFPYPFYPNYRYGIGIAKDGGVRRYSYSSIPASAQVVTPPLN